MCLPMTLLFEPTMTVKQHVDDDKEIGPRHTDRCITAALWVFLIVSIAVFGVLLVNFLWS